MRFRTGYTRPWHEVDYTLGVPRRTILLGPKVGSTCLWNFIIWVQLGIIAIYWQCGISFSFNNYIKNTVWPRSILLWSRQQEISAGRYLHVTYNLQYCQGVPFQQKCGQTIPPLLAIAVGNNFLIPGSGKFAHCGHVSPQRFAHVCMTCIESRMRSNLFSGKETRPWVNCHCNHVRK